MHNRRKQQAQTYLEESGVCNLAQKFTEAIGGHCRSYFEGGYYSDLDLKTKTDPDSSSIDVIWDIRRVGTSTIGMANGSMEYDVNEGRGFTIECRPNGNIVFHGGLFGRSRIPVEKWRDKRDVLEMDLEKAYNRPHTGKYTNEAFGRWSPGYDSS